MTVGTDMPIMNACVWIGQCLQDNVSSTGPLRRVGRFDQRHFRRRDGLGKRTHFELQIERDECCVRTRMPARSMSCNLAVKLEPVRAGLEGCEAYRRYRSSLSARQVRAHSSVHFDVRNIPSASLTDRAGLLRKTLPNDATVCGQPIL